MMYFTILFIGIFKKIKLLKLSKAAGTDLAFLAKYLI